MAQQAINIGSTANDGTGDTLRDAFNKANANFTEIYTAIVITGGITNSEHLLSPMPDFSGQPRNTINDAGVAQVTGCTNLGAAGGGASNRIASEARPATGAGLGNSVFNANFVDDDLSSATQMQNVSIFGAYDQVCNSIGSSCIASPHSFIKFNTGGHNTIVGGSSCLMSGSTQRSAHVAGFASVIHNGNFVTSICNETVDISGASRSVVLGCIDTTVTGTSVTVVSAGAVTVSATGGMCVGSNTYSGQHSLVTGATNNVGGGYGITAGQTNENDYDHAAVFGRDCVANHSGTLNLSQQKISVRGDAQTYKVVRGAQSTGAGVTLNLATFISTIHGSGTMRISLVGHEVGGTSMIGFVNDVTFRKNGAVANFVDASGSGTDLYRALTYDTSSLTWAAGNSGLVRLAGNASTMRLVTPTFTDSGPVIKWVASFDITFTREDDVDA